MRLLDAASAWSLRHPRGTAALAAVALALAAAALSRVRLETDVTEIVRTRSARTFARAAELFDLNENAVLVIEADRAGREQDLLRFGRELAARLAGSPAVAAVEFGFPIDPDQLVSRLVLPCGPLYTRPADLAALDRLLAPEGLRAELEKQAARLALLGLSPADEWTARDPLELGRPLVGRLRSLAGSARFAQGSPFFLSEDGRALLVSIAGRGDRKNGPAAARATVAAIDGARTAILAEPWAAGLTVRATGACYVGEEAERIIRGDLIATLSGSIMLSAILLAITLRTGPLTAVLLFLPTLWGSACGIGLFAGIRPDMTALSLGCAVILVGLGDDFMIHVASASFAARATGLAPSDAVLHAVRETREPVLGAAFTAIAAFASFLVSRQVFLREIGVLTAIGLVACVVGALVVLPPILRSRLAREGERRLGRPPLTLGVAWSAGASVRRARAVAAVSALVSVAAIALLVARPPALEDDLRNIHARHSKPLLAQARISRIFGGSHEPILVLLDAADEPALLEACHRLEAPLGRLVREGMLVSRESIAPFVPPLEDQRRALALLATKDPAKVARDLVAALDAAGFDPAAFDSYVRGVAAAVAEREPVTLERLRAIGLEPLVRRFVRPRQGGGASALVAVYPREDLWTAAARGGVVAALERALGEARVDGALTGLYQISDESAQQVAEDFSRISLLTGAAIVVFVALHFRRLGHTALALLPIALGVLWTAALFTAAGYRLNLMNLGVLPMVVGIGADDGIHILHRWLARPANEGVAPTFRTTGAAVALSSLTTMVAFGSLALSRNLGISSVGVLTLFGIGSSLLASVVTLPAMLEIFARD